MTPIVFTRRLVGFLVPGLLIAGPAFAADESTTAIKANDFLNSIGVCAHISQGEDNPIDVAKALVYAGIRGVRDDGSTNPKTLQAFIDVHQASGTRFSLLPINGNVTASLQEYETLAAAGALLAAEGPNEPNNFHVTYKGEKSSKKTSMPVARFQADLYAAVKADAKLAGIPVFHSSEAGGSEPDNCGLQFLTIPAGAGTLMPDGTKFADFANTHNYVCGHNLKGITEDNIAWNAEDPTLNGTWDGMMVEYGHTWWGKGFDGYSKANLEKLPRVTTETGWSTATGNGGSDTKISEDEQGKLFLNLYLDAFKRGWSYTFIYMLRDSRGQGAWGLIHNDYTPKASGTYLHNMTTLLADKSSAFTPGKIGYSIPNQPATVHDLLMQKSTGTFELAVWDEQAKGSSDISVELGAVYPSVKVYDPTAGVEAVQTLANVKSVPLKVSDHAFIIEIESHATPAAGDAPRERVLFEDQFNGKLGEGWSWLYEDKDNWRVEGGKLQIRATGGASFMKEHDGKNYLLRTPPDVKNGELSVEAYVENKPTEQYEHAGLMWFYDDDNFVVINKECFGGKASIICFVEKDGKPIKAAQKPPEIPWDAEGVWMRFRVTGNHIIGECRATPTDPWREVGNGELPVKGPPTVGFHAGFAPKKELNRWASFSHFKIAELVRE